MTLNASGKLLCLLLVGLLLALLAVPVFAAAAPGLAALEESGRTGGFTARMDTGEPAVAIACTPPSGSSGGCGGG